MEEREERSTLLLKQAHDAVGRRLNNNLRDSDLTNVQLGMLIALEHSEEKRLKLKEIEKIFHVSQPTVVGIADRMEEKGLIRTVKDPADKRVRMVEITEEGLSKCHQAHEVMLGTEELMLKGFSQEEKALVKDFLKRMRLNLQE